MEAFRGVEWVKGLKDPGQKYLHDLMQEKLRGVDCVLAFESASDYLATNKMTYRPSLYVYARQELNIQGVECTIIDSYDGLELVDDGVLRCTSVQQTIIDLLRYDRDPQVTIEAIADWYYTHNESYAGLTLPADVQPLFDDCAEDAINYYNDG